MMTAAEFTLVADFAVRRRLRHADYPAQRVICSDVKPNPRRRQAMHRSLAYKQRVA
jgi:hypothetical protein